MKYITDTQAMTTAFANTGTDLARNLGYSMTKAVGTISEEKRHRKQLAAPYFIGTRHTLAII